MAEVDDQPTIGLWLMSSSEAPQTLSIARVTGRFGRKMGGHTVAANASVVLHDKVHPTVFAPRSAVRLDIDVKALDCPGEYTGDLELDPGNGKSPIVATVTVLVSRSMGWAAGLIALGIVATLGITWLRDRLQPRTELRIALRQRLAELDAMQPGNEVIAAAARQLRTQAQTLWSKITEGASDDLRKTIEGLSDRIALLLAANASIAAIAQLSSPATQRAKRKIVDEVLAIAVDLAARIDDGRDKLRCLGLDDAKRSELGEALDAVEHSTQEHRDSLDPMLVTAIDKTVTPALEAAESARTADDLVSLQHELVRARSALAAAGLRSMLAALERRPDWVDAAAWDALVRKVLAKIPAKSDDLADAYEAIRDTYVAEVEAILRHLTAQQQQALSDAGKPADGELAAALAGIDAAQSRRDRVAALWRLQERLKPSPPGAKVHDRILLGFAGPQPGAPPSYAVGVQLLPELPSVTKIPLGGVVVPGAGDAPWKDIRRRLWATQWLVAGVVFLLALASGLKLLWIDNATWGSPSDLLAAVLWGTGAKLTADAFAGLAWLRSALGKNA
jgi:hypothetical protein